MDAKHFDILTRSLHAHNRRRVIGLLSGVGVATIAGTLGLDLPREAAARCKKKCGPCQHCRKRKCKPNPQGSPGTKCPGADTDCEKRVCASGKCSTAFEANGKPIATQTAGDCKVVVCDGAGNTRTDNDNNDLPEDGNECTIDTCQAGTPLHINSAIGSPCTDGSCDGNGNCVPT